MEIVVGSKHLATQVFTALDNAGREHLVIVAKATWQIPAAGQRPRPLEPVAIAASDIYLGEPGDSPMLYGADTVRFKPSCDVLFNANAYAPAGSPQRVWMVGFRIGNLQKTLRVYGPRHWIKRLGAHELSEAVAAESVPLHHGMAFGGSRLWERTHNGKSEHLTEALLSNPCGKGWAGPNTLEQIDGMPAPQLESPNDAISKPNGKHQPHALSAVGRHWLPRSQYAGTYDENWQREVFPFLPEDFDDRFNQCAPVDQQIAYPTGGEEVVLLNLSKTSPDIRFRLPNLGQPVVRVLRDDYQVEMPACVVDTLYFEPDLGQFSAVWRTSTPVKRRIQEFKTIAIGTVNTEWWRAQQLGLNGGCVGCGRPSEAAYDDEEEDA
ncbi:DUF2169 domain-containing protein [Chitinimonas sp.]|uniref:DUF2169 family type VI secretion system accessory protein n=1 Tax=Chitinimonas sp. TaxID=1934313 RepID=UPI002F95F7EB